MQKKLHEHKVGISVGFMLSGFHLVWIILVILGLAQPLLNTFFWTHMVDNPYQITGFTVQQAGTLLVVTFCVGYVLGRTFSHISNAVHK